ncbi:hypothetical protein J8273_1887 [Carpediemonas membranifera]|uniref:Uncharacterized protein n=1 Tax=Carpediemonas membranifera TaxID=201153 RepID=A0A8J6B270_9EUKA|nr:hypothetical protein J8273_1887 [Carpediemonas membranifera]|eukprot:KAG9396840.1 hypothetical protein J8273_1887 [Carpediemonas membranifera]
MLVFGAASISLDVDQFLRGMSNNLGEELIDSCIQRTTDDGVEMKIVPLRQAPSQIGLSDIKHMRSLLILVNTDRPDPTEELSSNWLSALKRMSFPLSNVIVLGLGTNPVNPAAQKLESFCMTNLLFSLHVSPQTATGNFILLLAALDAKAALVPVTSDDAGPICVDESPNQASPGSPRPSLPRDTVNSPIQTSPPPSRKEQAARMAELAQPKAPTPRTPARRPRWRPSPSPVRLKKPSPTAVPVLTIDMGGSGDREVKENRSSGYASTAPVVTERTRRTASHSRDLMSCISQLEQVTLSVSLGDSYIDDMTIRVTDSSYDVAQQFLEDHGLTPAYQGTLQKMVQSAINRVVEQASMSAPSREIPKAPFLRLKVPLGKGKSGVIAVREGDDPVELVESFSKAFQLRQYDALKLLALVQEKISDFQYKQLEETEAPSLSPLVIPHQPSKTQRQFRGQAGSPLNSGHGGGDRAPIPTSPPSGMGLGSGNGELSGDVDVGLDQSSANGGGEFGADPDYDGTPEALPPPAATNDGFDDEEEDIVINLRLPGSTQPQRICFPRGMGAEAITEELATEFELSDRHRAKVLAAVLARFES